jgi:hypothetical protein
MVLASGLSRNTCLPAAADVVARCTSFGVVLMIASILGSASIVSRLAGSDISPQTPGVFPRSG